MVLGAALNRDTVKALGAVAPVEIGPDRTVEEAIALMQKRATGCLVITEHGRPVGVLTERDISKKVLARNSPVASLVADVMTRDPMTVAEESSVAVVVRAMHAGGFRHMPMVDSVGRLTGLVSVKRIVEYLVDHFPEAVFNLPPEPGQKQSAREGA